MTHRNAANHAIAQLRQGMLDQTPRGEVERISTQFETDLSCTLLGCMADLMDQGVEYDDLGVRIIHALSGVLGSYVLTVTQGDKRQAVKLAKRSMRLLADNTDRRMRRGSDYVFGGGEAMPAV